MKIIVSVFTVNLTCADATDNFMPWLKATPFDAIDVALVKLGLFVGSESRSSQAKDTQLKFIHTDNCTALTSVIKNLLQSRTPLKAMQP